MANATILYCCTESDLAIFNKPGTLTEWLPPRRTLTEQPVTSVWAEPGPPIRVAAIAGGALQVSDNGGRTWQAIGLGEKPVALWGRTGEGETAQATIYAAMQGGRVAASQDGGATWEDLPPLPIEITNARHVGDGPNGTVLLMAFTTAGGGRLLVGDPESGSWQTPYTKITSDAAHAPGSDTFYALTPTGISYGRLEGQEWDPMPGAPAGGVALAAIPGPAGKPPALLVGNQSGLALSADGGQSWTAISLPNDVGVVALTRDPERRDRIYAALSTGYLCESGNRGQTWEPVNAQPLPRVTGLYAIRI